MAKAEAPQIQSNTGNSDITLEAIDPTGVIGTIPAWKSTIGSLNGSAKTYAGASVGSIPGVGDPAELVRKTLKDEAGKYVGEIKDAIMELILTLQAPDSVSEEDIPKINILIRKVNALILDIEKALNTLNGFAETVFPIIAIITAVFIASKILSLLPVPGAGMGVVVSFPVVNNIAPATHPYC